MTARFEVNGDKTKIIFEYEASTTLMQLIIGHAAKYLWKDETDVDGIVTNPFSEATNQEKLDVVYNHVKRVILDLANTFKSLKAQKDARELEKENEYQIE